MYEKKIEEKKEKIETQLKNIEIILNKLKNELV